jgi:hypothetical protein
MGPFTRTSVAGWRKTLVNEIQTVSLLVEMDAAAARG